MIAIPYEPQLLPRSCGAAALCMVTRSLGLECDQGQVHAAVRTRADPEAGATTRSLANRVLNLGLDALIVQARDPWAMVQACVNSELRAILNHRLDPPEQGGHYSVLVDADEETIVLHDPLSGPNRRRPRDEFLALWGPTWPSEIAGFVLVLVGLRTTQTEPTQRCRQCRSSIPLGLAVTVPETMENLWRRAFCPWCDRDFIPPPRPLRQGT